MKQVFLFNGIIFALAYGLAVAAQLLGYLPFDVLSVRAFIGTAIAAAIVAVALGDYTWKPRFQVRSLEPAATPDKHGTFRPKTAASHWPYTTRHS